MKRAFTLIELLVVIAIIGLLATLSVVSFTGIKEKAQIAEARSDLRQIIALIRVAREETGLTAYQISNDNCSDCDCRIGDMRDTVGICLTRWQNSLTDFINATNGQVTGAEKFIRDPWGSPYALDENEREYNPADCRQDVIRSLGPDGTYNTGDDVSLTDDARFTSIIFSKPCP